MLDRGARAAVHRELGRARRGGGGGLGRGRDHIRPAGRLPRGAVPRTLPPLRHARSLVPEHPFPFLDSRRPREAPPDRAPLLPPAGGAGALTATRLGPCGRGASFRGGRADRCLASRDRIILVHRAVPVPPVPSWGWAPHGDPG